MYDAGILRHNITAGDTEFNWTSVSEGDYSYYVYANDTSGNENLSLLRTITLDTTYPAISWVNPASDSNYSTKDYVYFNATVTDVTNTSSWLDFNNSLVGYWGMDYYNSTGVYDNSSYNHFGIFNGDITSSNVTDSKRGKGVHCTAAYQI